MFWRLNRRGDPGQRGEGECMGDSGRAPPTVRGTPPAPDLPARVLAAHPTRRALMNAPRRLALEWMGATWLAHTQQHAAHRRCSTEAPPYCKCHPYLPVPTPDRVVVDGRHVGHKALVLGAGRAGDVAQEPVGVVCGRKQRMRGMVRQRQLRVASGWIGMRRCPASRPAPTQGGARAPPPTSTPPTPPPPPHPPPTPTPPPTLPHPQTSAMASSTPLEMYLS